MAAGKGDEIKINNSGNVGALAVGRGATAIHATDNANVDVTAKLDEHYRALEQLIECHQESAELKILLKNAIDLSRSDNPAASRSIWEKISQYGGALGSLVGGVVSLLAL
jgi:hypothetical protein